MHKLSGSSRAVLSRQNYAGIIRIRALPAGYSLLEQGYGASKCGLVILAIFQIPPVVDKAIDDCDCVSACAELGQKRDMFNVFEKEAMIDEHGSVLRQPDFELAQRRALHGLEREEPLSYSMQGTL